MQNNEIHKVSEGITFRSFNMKGKERLIIDVDFQQILKYATIRPSDLVN